MAGNDNAPSSSHEVRRALAALRELRAPVERISWGDAEERWRWAVKEIGVVIDSPVASRAELVEALWAMSGWLRYLAFHCPKLKGRAKAQAMDSWLDLCRPLERMQEIEVCDVH